MRRGTHVVMANIFVDGTEDSGAEKAMTEIQSS